MMMMMMVMVMVMVMVVMMMMMLVVTTVLHRRKSCHLRKLRRVKDITDDTRDATGTTIKV